MNRHYVVRITAAGEEAVFGPKRISLAAAESKRDQLNEELARQGVKYGECRYAVRIADERRLAAGAAA